MDSTRGDQTVPRVLRRLGILIGVAVLGTTTSCAAPDEPLFRARELPVPMWLNERWAELCVGRAGTTVTEELAEAGAPEALTSGDAPCSVTSDSTGGGAVFDFTEDGLPDLVWTTSVLGSPVFLANLGNMEFLDVTEMVAPGVDLHGANGVALGDIDRDGDTDLFFTTFGRKDPVLLRYEGRGTFVDVTPESGLLPAFPVVNNGTSAVFGDYDDDGWLDLYTMESRLLEVSARNTPGGARLFRNRGGEGRPGVFEDVTESAGVVMRQKNGSLLTFTGAFHDIDGDDLLDLIVVSDFNTSELFLNNGDGTFRDGSAEFPFTDEEAGMGLAIGDVTGDGNADVLVVGGSQFPATSGDTRTCRDLEPLREFGRDGSTGNGLFSFTDGGFTEVTDVYGVRHSGWGWGAVMTDFDLDSRTDILTVGSHSIGFGSVKAYCIPADSAWSVVRLWRNTGTSTEEISAESGLVVSGRLKSPLAADFDLDGDDDLVVFRSGDRPLLFENRTATGDSISLVFSGEELRQNARITVNFADGSPPSVRFAVQQNGLFTARHSDEIVGTGGRGKVASIVVEYRSGRVVTIEEPRVGSRIEVP